MHLKIDNPIVSRKRLSKEFSDLSNEPLPTIRIDSVSEDMLTWRATILGPPDSPYEGGVFGVIISFPTSYPFMPPRVAFTTPVYHCNVHENGAICLDILKNAWSPSLSIRTVLLSIASLLCDCNPEDPLVPEIGNLFKVDRIKHDENAREHTIKHAIPSVASEKCFVDS